MNDTLREKIRLLPDSPGCYLMKRNGEVIYVGKAVNLKNRVRSYFHASAGHTPKVAAMVAQVDDFDIVLCQTGFEALTLECNLIKSHQPFYNILLKDDKHYPYLRLDEREAFPRFTIARRQAWDGARYFGPYVGATAVRQVLEDMRRIFPLRTCALRFPLKAPRRPCVNYEIGQCLAPCAGLCDAEAYAQVLRRAVAFLQGKYQEVLRDLEQQMTRASEALQFERAAAFRDRMRDIERLMEKQSAIQTRDTAQDVLAVAALGVDALVQLVRVRGGKMLEAESHWLPGDGQEERPRILSSFLTQYYEEGETIPPEILVGEELEDMEELARWLRERRGGAVRLARPQRGEKRALVEIAEKNARDAIVKKLAETARREERTSGAAAALARALDMKGTPRRIEGFDISNIQGVYQVASMVVFIGGKPARAQYRHFRIKTVEGANDFASMNEVLGRRFRHGLEEKAEREAAGLPLELGRFSDLPDLILIDGGPEQLRFAQEAMHAAGVAIPMFGLAKRLEEIWLPHSDTPILLDRRSPALHLIQRVRDEAHRFAITFHRAVRGKSTLESRLMAIPGVGPKRCRDLLRRFHGLRGVMSASLAELEATAGLPKEVARAIYAAGAGGSTSDAETERAEGSASPVDPA